MQDKRFDQPSNQPLPLVMAGGSNLHKWPSSRIEMPVQFQICKDGFSAFQKTIIGINARFGPKRPMVTVPSSLIETVRDQLDIIGMGDWPHILIEPMDRGSLPASILASLYAQQICDPKLVLIVNPSQVFDWQLVRRTVEQIVEGADLNDRLICFGRPLREGEATQTDDVQKSKRVSDNHLHTYAKSNDGGEEPSFRIGSLTLAPLQKYIDTVTQYDATTVNRCRQTMEHLDILESAIWPDLNIWTSLKPKDLRPMLAALNDHGLLRPADLYSLPSIHSSGSFLQADCIDCITQTDGHLVAVAGCSGLEITATKDATLIAAKGAQTSIDTVLKALKERESAQLYQFPTRHHGWGDEADLTHRESHHVSEITINPGQQYDNSNNVRGNKVWLIVAGEGEVEMNQSIRALKPGNCLQIAHGQYCEIRNRGNLPFTAICTNMRGQIAEIAPELKDICKPSKIHQLYSVG